VYESDVRFERCLALDWKVDVSPSIRKRCWEEWSTFFSEGQTLDRVNYAKRQIEDPQALGAAPTDGIASASKPLVAVPEPTSVFVAPPMMLASDGGDGGPLPTDGGTAVVDAPVVPPCEAKCDDAFARCTPKCKTAICEKYCTERHALCMKRCVPKE
jgi:hypothetical protein